MKFERVLNFETVELERILLEMYEMVGVGIRHDILDFHLARCPWI